MRSEPRFEVRYPIAGQCGNHECRGKLCGLVGGGRQLQKRWFAYPIDLVDHKDFGSLYLTQPRKNVGCNLIEPMLGVEHAGGDICVLDTRPGARHHCTVEPSPGCEDTRRVDEDELRAPRDCNPAQRRTCRLGFVRNDRDLVADKRVDQGRLADVRGTNDRNEPAAALFLRHQPRSALTPAWVSMAAAAACSAARFERPRPSAGASWGSSTITRNSGS